MIDKTFSPQSHDENPQQQRRNSLTPWDMRPAVRITMDWWLVLTTIIIIESLALIILTIWKVA